MRLFKRRSSDPIDPQLTGLRFGEVRTLTAAWCNILIGFLDYNFIYSTHQMLLFIFNTIFMFKGFNVFYDLKKGGWWGLTSKAKH